MTIFSIYFLIATYWQFQPIEEIIHSFAAPAQEICKNLLNFNSRHLVFYQAIACGTSVNNPTYEVLKTVSLWHVVIVSAGHFKVIQWALKRLIPERNYIHLLILFLFCLWTGAQPPVVRAYLELLMKKASTGFKLWIPEVNCLVLTGALGLIFFPSWATSWSFLLSWLCALLLLLLKNQSLIKQALGIWLGLLPVISLFSTPHPLSFLFNIALGPALSSLLFPATLLMTVVSSLHLIVDPLLEGLLFLLNSIIVKTSTSSTTLILGDKQLVFCWLYVLSLQIYLILRERLNVSFKN